MSRAGHLRPLSLTRRGTGRRLHAAGTGCTPRSCIALIIVMLVILVLAVLAGGFAYSVKVETTLARNASHDQDFEWLGRSGVELARFVLAQQIPNEPYDALNQKWAGGPMGTNDALASVSLTDVRLGPGTFQVKILDCERKLNINFADASRLARALQLCGVDANEAGQISDSIQDWIDRDDQPRISGAESDYYLSLTPPYQAKNGPLDDLSELMLIRGVVPEMFTGTDLSQIDVPRSVTGRALAVNKYTGPIYTNALRDIFTTTSVRAVNINTASALVLQTVLGVDTAAAQAIVMYRAGLDGQEGTEDDAPFRMPAQMASVAPVPQPVLQALGQFLAVRSTVFEVEVTVDIGGQKRTMVALVSRANPRDVRALFTHWK
ncbi:MAG: general secretion pathway protein GspK [Verrucomicrobia bacterium]|nr:general secretion pathway protein GspK [Verrucomicrobiota bacterium]